MHCYMYLAALQPIESLTPVLREPYLPGKKALILELLPKLKAIFMASYFGFDHLVWFGSVGIIKDKQRLERCADL
jgi:Peroxisomal biogenesis factor 11 (PEX11)